MLNYVLTNIGDITEEFSEFRDLIIPKSIVPVLVQLISTLIIFILVAKLFFKPIREILRKRAEYVENQIKDAENARINALQYENEAQSSISAANNKSKIIIEEAYEKANQIKDNALVDLEKEIAEKRLKVEQEIIASKEAAIEEIRKEIINVAIDASEVILNREVNKEDNASLVNEFVKDIVN